MTRSTNAAGVCRQERSGWRSWLRTLASDLLYCGGVATVLTIIFAAIQDGGPKTWVPIFVTNLIISAAIGASLSNLYRFVYDRLRRRFRGRVANGVIHLLLVVGGVALGVEVALRIIDVLGGPSPHALRSNVFRIGLVVATVIMVTLIAFERLRTHAREVELQAQQAQRDALRAQLETLQARTNPHFLFNSLNTVAGLIEEDPKAAERVLERLSSLFRYSLEGSRAVWVRIEDEVRSVHDYLEVEQIRLGDRLRSQVEVASELEPILVPPLILQPLVENAILHAVAPRRAGGSVDVRAWREGSVVMITVTDDGPGLGGSSRQGSGSSLTELRQRIELVYSGEAKLETRVPDGGGCEIRLTLPFQPQHQASSEGLPA